MTIRTLRAAVFVLLVMLVPFAPAIAGTGVALQQATPATETPATETPEKTPDETPVPTLTGAAVYMPAIAKPQPAITLTPLPTGTVTGTPTITPTITPTATLTGTATPTGTISPTGTPTITPTITVTPTGTVTPTLTPTVTVIPTGTPGALQLIPFDTNGDDLLGPTDWMANYGKQPEIVAAASGSELDVLLQDYNAGTTWNGALLHIAPAGRGGYAVTQAFTHTAMLERVMGLAVDAEGNRYFAAGVDEDAEVNPNYPPANTYRSNIVRVVKVNAAGETLFDVDLDVARHAASAGAEMIVNPMVAATARLGVGGGEVALVHGINTEPDWNIGGQRHQKALSTRLSAADGSILRTGSIWVSHSFDQRLLYDGEGIVELHLGDAYPRYIAFGRNHAAYPLFHIKGPLGENLTATRLGDIVRIENDATYRYLALFATESSATAGTMSNPINGARNLAVVRIKGSDNSIDPSLPSTLVVNSSGVSRTNLLRWLTNYSADSNLHAERPKMVALGSDRYVVLWEEWSTRGEASSFRGVYGMVIDAAGSTVAPAARLTSTAHLPRGDDAFVLDGRAAWLTGDAGTRTLMIHFVDAALQYEEEVVGLP